MTVRTFTAEDIPALLSAKASLDEMYQADMLSKSTYDEASYQLADRLAEAHEAS